MLDAYFFAAATLGGLFFCLWLISLMTRKVSFVDGFWGFGFVVAAWAAAAALPPDSLGARGFLVLGLVTLWGGRLGLYLGRRFLKEGEDKRYKSMLKRRGKMPFALYSLLIVFTLQAMLILLVAAPVISALTTDNQSLASTSMETAFSVLGMTLFLIGFGFEVIGDAQLARFKADPDNSGKVMDRGLWAWTRHPNYFGDACLWWGLWCFTHDPILLISPIFMTFTLMKWSGAPLLEAGLKKSRPGYETYMARTSAFFPQPPQNNT